MQRHSHKKQGEATTWQQRRQMPRGQLRQHRKKEHAGRVRCRRSAQRTLVKIWTNRADSDALRQRKRPRHKLCNAETAREHEGRR